MNRIYEDEKIAIDLCDVLYIEKAGCGYRVWLMDVDDCLVFDMTRGGYLLNAWKAYICGDEEAA